MSGTAALKQRLRLLQEISTIMDSIKTIAIIETQHSRGWLASQREGMAAFRGAAARFLDVWYPQAIELNKPEQVVLMVGSERGFCGDFNSRLVESLSQQTLQSACKLIPVGYRLWSKLQNDKRVAQPVPGANVAAELEDTLAAVFDGLSALSADGFDRVSVMFHDGADNEPRVEPLLSGLAHSEGSPQWGCAPLINLPPALMLAELTAQFVYARLNYILTASFVAENERRIQHIGSALERMQEQREQLSKKHNQLRQEQITEELEIILLNGNEAVGV